MAQIGDDSQTIFTVDSANDFIFAPFNGQFFVEELVEFQRDEMASESTYSTESGNAHLKPNPIVERRYLKFTRQNVGDRHQIIFGTDLLCCDVLIPSLVPRPVGERLFAVEFPQGPTRAAVLWNLSNNGTCVSWHGKRSFQFKTSRSLPDSINVYVNIPSLVVALTLFIHPFPAPQLFQSPAQSQLHITLPVARLQMENMPMSSQPLSTTNPWIKVCRLGSGGFGEVWRALHATDGRVVAIKVLDKSKQKEPHALLKEAAVLRPLNHRNVVHLIDFICVPDGDDMLVMDLIQSFDLEFVLRRQVWRRKYTQALLRELLQGLDYLHSKHVTHRDVKPANILIASLVPMTIKITDFGLAATRKDELMTSCGTPLYLAPEVYRGSYTNKVDLWAVGVIALELIKGLPQYPQVERQRRQWPGLLTAHLEQQPCTPLFYSFVQSLLQIDPNRRPSAMQSLGDRFLQVALEPGLELPSTPPVNQPQPIDPGPAAVSQDDLYGPATPKGNQTQVFAPLPVVEAPPQVIVDPNGDVLEINYDRFVYEGTAVMYRREDGLINFTQLAKAIGRDNIRWGTLLKPFPDMHKVRVQGRPRAGTYVCIKDAKRILQSQGWLTQPLTDWMDQFGVSSS